MAVCLDPSGFHIAKKDFRLTTQRNYNPMFSHFLGFVPLVM